MGGGLTYVALAGIELADILLPLLGVKTWTIQHILKQRKFAKIDRGHPTSLFSYQDLDKTTNTQCVKIDVQG